MNAVTGLLALALLTAQGNPSESQPTTQKTWALPLSEAIRVGLGHSEIVRITCERVEEDDQVYVTIAPRDPAVSRRRFRTETTALVRTIEQRYCELARQRAELAACAQAVQTGRALLECERADAAATLHYRVADRADVEAYLGEFEAELAEKRSDVASAERQLRKVMGIGTSDARAIVPVTPAAKTDWKTCLATPVTLDQQLNATERLRRAAAKRVEVQKTFYEEGRTPVDRYLKAVSGLANAAAQEARAQYSYNLSLMAFEEAKGTLLDYRQVTIEGTAE